MDRGDHFASNHAIRSGHKIRKWFRAARQPVANLHFFVTAPITRLIRTAARYRADVNN
jgi:hypothetical protein